MNDLFKLKPIPGTGFLVLSFAVLSASLGIFVFDKDLFFKLSYIQLISLSVAGIAPLIVLNSFLFLLYIFDYTNEVWNDSEVLKYFSGALLFGSIVSMVFIDIILTIKLLFGISLIKAIVFSVIFELAVFLTFKFSPKKK